MGLTGSLSTTEEGIRQTGTFQLHPPYQLVTRASSPASLSPGASVIHYLCRNQQEQAQSSAGPGVPSSHPQTAATQPPAAHPLLPSLLVVL